VDFDEWVAARGDDLWRSAWLLTGDTRRAEDLVQTALGKCWPHWPRLSGDGGFEAYVRRTMLTTYLAWWRRRWNGEVPTSGLPVALTRLPKGQRAAVVLRYFEDLTEQQTADVLGVRVDSVKSRNARALATLRTSFDSEDSLRDALARAVPAPPASLAVARAAGARATAARLRRHKMNAIAVAASGVLAVVTLVSGR